MFLALFPGFQLVYPFRGCFFDGLSVVGRLRIGDRQGSFLRNRVDPFRTQCWEAKQHRAGWASICLKVWDVLGCFLGCFGIVCVFIFGHSKKNTIFRCYRFSSQERLKQLLDKLHMKESELVPWSQQRLGGKIRTETGDLWPVWGRLENDFLGNLLRIIGILLRTLWIFEDQPLGKFFQPELTNNS